MDSRSQRNGVQVELIKLREKQLAKSRRESLKGLNSPLTTPEEAQAFLASMRDAQHKRERTHKPPAGLNADGMDAWYLEQRKKEQEIRKKRHEAETILRSYRSSYTMGNVPSPRSVGGGLEQADALFEDPNEPSGSEIGLPNSAQFMQTRITKDDEKKESETIKSSPGLKISTDLMEDVTVWRDFISSEPGSKFPPEAGRYHLYCSYACPGSHRALIVRALKGLDKAISVSFLHPVWRLTNPDDPFDKHRGWVFGNPEGEPFGNTINKGGPFPSAYEGNDPDPEFNAFSIREIYEYAEDTSGKFTIPLLWDRKLKTIVNNESSDIAYMFNSCLNDFAENPDLDLYTEDNAVEKAKLSAVSEWLSPLMIHGVYRCGFAKTQWAYDRAINDLCAAFDRADDTLEQQRFLTGDTLTDADVRLFVTLFRFDEVYTIYFKANARLVMLTPSLLNFCREMYQLPGVAETCNMEQIKAHFFASHAEWNKYSVIPRGLGFMELLDMPHDRAKLAFSGPDEPFSSQGVAEV